MSVFVDTSALYALLDIRDASHAAAQTIWQRLLQADTPWVSTSYVLSETFALIQRRLGMAAVRDLQDDLLPAIEVYWVTELVHNLGVQLLLTANRRVRDVLRMAIWQLT